MSRKVHAVFLLGTLQSLPVLTHQIQSCEFVGQCFINGFNRTIIQLLQLYQSKFAVTKCLYVVTISMKTADFLKMGHADLAHVSLASFLVPGPILDLTCPTAISHEFARSTQTSTRLITSWTRTNCNIGRFSHGNNNNGYSEQSHPIVSFQISNPPQATD